MITKFLVAALFAWVCWRLWRGNPRRRYPLVARRPRGVAGARALLGVAEGADEAAIRAAHRRVIADAHPDRGGSEAQAVAANAARDALLADLRQAR